MRARGVIVGAVVAYGLLALVDAAGAATRQEAEPADVAGLEQAFQVADIPSDYVVVIDTSQSMSDGPDPLYPKVEAAYASLVDAIPDGDRLTLITFDSTVTTRPLTLDSSNRATASELPSANGDATDIGAALSSAVEALDQPDAADIQTVIFLTDGLPNPRPGSPFDPVGSEAWQRAHDRAARIEDRRSVRVRALGLTDEGKQGADLAAEVFGSPETVQVSGDDLQSYLTAEVRNARRRALERAIRREIRNGSVAVDVTTDDQLGNDVKATVELTSRLEHLGVDLDLDAVTARDFEGDPVRSSIVGGSRTIHLSPGGSETFEVLVKPSVERAPLFSLPPPGREEIDISLDFSESANATPTEVLQEDLGVDTAVTVEDADPFTVGRDTGKTWLRFLLELTVLAIALVILVRLWWLYVRRPDLFGTLVLATGSTGVDGPSVDLKGKKAVVEASDFGRTGATRIKLYTRRGRRKQIFADRVGVDGSFQRQVRKNRWEEFRAGEQLGATVYRMDGDGGTRFRWRRGEEET